MYLQCISSLVFLQSIVEREKSIHSFFGLELSVCTTKEAKHNQHETLS